MKIKEDKNRELRNLRTLLDIMERGMEDNNDKLKTTIEALKKLFLDKLKHLTANFNEKTTSL